MIPTNGQKATARPSIQAAAVKAVARAGRACSKAPRYSTILGALTRDEVRSRVLDRFKACGGDRNRWSGTDHHVMADALSHAEDWLEVEHPRLPERETLAILRRKLEGCVM